MTQRKSAAFLNQSTIRRISFLLFISFLLNCNLQGQANEYFADILPTERRIPFNTELVPNGMLIHSGIFSPDLEEYYFTISDKNFSRFDVKKSHKENGEWSQPEDAFFNTSFNEHGTSFTSDGKYVYFSSTRPVNVDGISSTWHIWRSEKVNGDWTDPVYVDIPNLRNKLVSHPSLSEDGTMYFHSGNTNYSDLNIYYSKQIDGVFQDAVKLPQEINISNQQDAPFISVDESFVLFESVQNLYISYKNNNGGWSTAKPLNSNINKNGKGNPYISPDSKYLFYAAGVEPSPDENWSVFWVSTDEVFKTTGVEENDGPLNNKFGLLQNYPNPFNPTTIINYSLPYSSEVRLVVYDILGNEVSLLVDDYKTAGQHSIEMDSLLLSSGIYIYRLTTGNTAISKKMLLLK